MTTSPADSTVHWRSFSLFLLASAALFGSWLWPVTRAGWDQLDAAVFFALNGSLASPSPWAHFWAVLNVRIFDLLPLALLLPFLLWPGLVLARQERIFACCHLFIILATMLVVRTVFEEIGENLLHWRGLSPSLTLEPAYRLGELYPALDPKDGSKESFPGDHAGVLMTVVGYLLLQRRNRWTALATGIALFYMLPRLFGGAHWLSDVIVGGGFIACVSLALGYCTSWPRLWAAELALRVQRHPLTPPWLK